MTDSYLRGSQRLVFGSLLFVAMGAAIFPPASLGILASFIIDDLGISRAQLGLVLSVMNISAAVLSPTVGRITDRLGGRSALLVLFGTAALVYALFGVSYAYVTLLVGGLAGAFAEASANPATNKLIAEHLQVGTRGVITGVKQSGVQAAIFLGGLLVPSAAIAWGWRATYLALALIPLFFGVLTTRIVPPSTGPSVGHADRMHHRLPSAIFWLAGYGLLLGFSGAVTFLVPLFVQESMGLGPRVAGLVVATIALFGFAGRIGWSRYAERTGAFQKTLGILAAISVVASIAFLASGRYTWLVWVAAAMVGISSSSWNSVGMLALMTTAGTAATGRASGIVLLGFLTGLGIGPVLYGSIVDTTGSYTGMWLLSAGSALLAIVTVLLWARTSRPTAVRD